MLDHPRLLVPRLISQVNPDVALLPHERLFLAPPSLGLPEMEKGKPEDEPIEQMPNAVPCENVVIGNTENVQKVEPPESPCHEETPNHRPGPGA